MMKSTPFSVAAFMDTSQIQNEITLTKRPLKWLRTLLNEQKWWNWKSLSRNWNPLFAQIKLNHVQKFCPCAHMHSKPAFAKFKLGLQLVDNKTDRTYVYGHAHAHALTHYIKNSCTFTPRLMHLRQHMLEYLRTDHKKAIVNWSQTCTKLWCSVWPPNSWLMALCLSTIKDPRCTGVHVHNDLDPKWNLEPAHPIHDQKQTS